MKEVVNFLLNNWIQMISIIISGVALYVSWRARIKNRAIYEIETSAIRQVRGRSDDATHDASIQKVNKKLRSGKYTILNISTREADGDFQVFLGRIAK